MLKYSRTSVLSSTVDESDDDDDVDDFDGTGTGANAETLSILETDNTANTPSRVLFVNDTMFSFPSCLLRIVLSRFVGLFCRVVCFSTQPANEPGNNVYVKERERGTVAVVTTREEKVKIGVCAGGREEILTFTSTWLE